MIWMSSVAHDTSVRRRNISHSLDRIMVEFPEFGSRQSCIGSGEGAQLQNTYLSDHLRNVFRRNKFFDSLFVQVLRG